MGWSVYQYGLATLMLVTGSINTLSTKWADNSKAVGNPDYTNYPRPFNHPFVQAVGMFIGEASCLLAFKLLQCYMGPSWDIGPQKFTPFIMMPPAMCDMCATSLMYMGLTLTYASSFQMLRGSVVIFTGLLSVAFLGRKLKTHQWLGIFIIFCGLLLVGVADIVEEPSNKDINAIITGDMLIIMAQIITATQMVIEEAFLSKYDVQPLQAVGWEGVFGFSVLSILLVPFYYMKVGQFREDSPDHRLEDAPDAYFQMINNPVIIIATVGTIVSIAFFNFAGISVTREMSATTRMVLDSLRTLVIWAVSLLIGWEDFHPLQLGGFFLLIFGTFIYNDAVFAPFLRNQGILKPLDQEPISVNIQDDESKPLLNPEDPSYEPSDERKAYMT